MIIYASRTGNVRFIVQKLGCPALELKDASDVTQPFILFTYTDCLGNIPLQVKDFLQQHATLCTGTFVSGNRNFGPLFAGAGKEIQQQFGIPTLYSVDLRGFPSDYEAMKKIYNETMVTV
jgi:protein involved in ribonucleotide reduction